MLRVLLVDDSQVFREAFKSRLRERWPTMVIEEARDSGEALDRIAQNPPHLVFLDMRLPKTNGLQLTRKIKKDFPHIHIALLTGYDVPEYREAAAQCGADIYLVKDLFHWDELVALLKSIEP